MRVSQRELAGPPSHRPTPLLSWVASKATAFVIPVASAEPREAPQVVLIVTYDLHQPGRDYEKIAEVLKKSEFWAHPQGSVWFLDTLVKPAQWRDRLKEAGDPNDEYFVAQMQKHWASSNLGQKMNDWLKNPTRRW
jgi:hypothetical protein